MAPVGHPSVLDSQGLAPWHFSFAVLFTPSYTLERVSLIFPQWFHLQAHSDTCSDLTFSNQQITGIYFPFFFLLHHKSLINWTRWRQYFKIWQLRNLLFRNSIIIILKFIFTCLAKFFLILAMHQRTFKITNFGFHFILLYTAAQISHEQYVLHRSEANYGSWERFIDTAQSGWYCSPFSTYCDECIAASVPQLGKH